MDRRRKALKWLAIIAALALVGFLAWLILGFFFGPAKPEDSGNSFVPSSFFPVSTPGGQGGGAAGGDRDGAATSTGPRGIPKLRQLSDVPTAGVVAYQRKEGAASFRGVDSTVFRWIERATGHIYETLDSDLTKTRVSNTTIPGVQEAFFSDDGQYVVARYLRADNETIETLVGKLEPSTQTTSNGYVYNETKLVTRFLEPGLLAAGDAPGDGFFYTHARAGNGSAVSLARYATGTPPTPLFQSDLAQWVVGWASTTLALTTKADPGSDGYFFLADVASGQMARVIDGRSGLTVSVNPAGTRALFSETVDNDLHLWVKNLVTGDEKILELRALPEKCAWDPKDEALVYCGAPDFYVRGAYPTNWHQGRFSFDDNIWRINVDTESYRALYDTRTGDETFDVWKPQVSPGGGFLMFLNKRDLTLWSLDVK